MPDTNGTNESGKARRESIGVALSGGGHRATIFGLGALLYLTDAGLNRSVRSITSVSGGSILNGFLGLLDKPFNAQSADEFEEHASRLAEQIAGHPKYWAGTAGFSVPALVLITILACRFHSGMMWAYALVLILVVGEAGSRSKGSMWAWRGTWIYLSSVLVATVAALFYVVQGPAWQRWLGAAILLLCGMAFAQRSAVTSMAFGASCCRLANNGKRSGRDRLEDLNDEVTHIICATEMHSGQHFFFLRNCVYSPGVGVGTSGGLHLRAAMQASANVPIAFPFRLIRSSRFRFGVWDQTRIPSGPTPIDTSPAEGLVKGVPRLFRLCDGGVFDNLAVSWFLKARIRFQNIESYLFFLSESKGHVEKVYGRDHEDALSEKLQAGRAALAALWSPDRIIVINGGKTPVWRNRISGWIPGVRELLESSEVFNVMYDNTQSERLHELQYRFAKTSASGAVVDMAEVAVPPWATDCVGEVERRRNEYLEQCAWPRVDIDALEKFVKSNATVPTTLRPLGHEKTAELLHHGYLQAMISLHVRMGAPLLAAPDRERFLKLASRHK